MRGKISHMEKSGFLLNNSPKQLIYCHSQTEIEEFKNSSDWFGIQRWSLTVNDWKQCIDSRIHHWNMRGSRTTGAIHQSHLYLPQSLYAQSQASRRRSWEPEKKSPTSELGKVCWYKRALPQCNSSSTCTVGSAPGLSLLQYGEWDRTVHCCMGQGSNTTPHSAGTVKRKHDTLKMQPKYRCHPVQPTQTKYIPYCMSNPTFQTRNAWKLFHLAWHVYK